MEKNKTVDYLRAVRDFDKSRGKKTEDFKMPPKDSAADGGVDYLKVSRKYQRYLQRDQSEVIRKDNRDGK